MPAIRLDLGHAIYYAAAGEEAQTFEALDNCFQRRDIFLPLLDSLPFFAPYRTGPRYRNLLVRMNLSPELV